MRHLLIGFVAVALSATVAQARPRYDTRPPEVIREATQPYHNLEAGAAVHAKERLMKRTNYSAMPMFDSAAKSNGGHSSFSGEGGGHSKPGSVKTALTPYQGLEKGAVARGMAHLVQKLNATAMPVGKDGGPMAKGGAAAASSGGKPQPLARALNPYMDLEKKSAMKGVAHLMQKANAQAMPHGVAYRPGESHGSSSLGGGMAGSVKSTREPYAGLEKAAAARGIAHLMQKCNATAMPHGTSGSRLDIAGRPAAAASGTSHDVASRESTGARTQP